MTAYGEVGENITPNLRTLRSLPQRIPVDPASGVVAQSEHITIDRSSWLHIDLDLSAIASLRDEGQVLLRRDWPEQFDPSRMYVIGDEESK